MDKIGKRNEVSKMVLKFVLDSEKIVVPLREAKK